jgi:hypothetical protein
MSCMSHRRYKDVYYLYIYIFDYHFEQYLSKKKQQDTMCSSIHLFCKLNRWKQQQEMHFLHETLHPGRAFWLFNNWAITAISRHQKHIKDSLWSSETNFQWIYFWENIIPMDIPVNINIAWTSQDKSSRMQLHRPINDVVIDVLEIFMGSSFYCQYLHN